MGGRKAWAGFEGLGNGLLRIAKNPLSPYQAWFKHVLDFEKKFLMNSEVTDFKNMFRVYTPPPGKGSNKATVQKTQPKAWSAGKILLVMLLSALILACLAFAITEGIKLKSSDREREESFVDLEQGQGRPKPKFITPARVPAAVKRAQSRE